MSVRNIVGAIAAATIAVESLDSALRREASSDARGEFRLDDLPVGGYHVVVSANGFAGAISNASIHPSDLIFGDGDGVVVVPQSVETEVLERAWAKVAGENITRDALRAGTSLAEVFRTHGIL